MHKSNNRDYIKFDFFSQFTCDIDFNIYDLGCQGKNLGFHNPDRALT